MSAPAFTPGPWEWNEGGRLFHNVPGSHSENVLVVHDPVWRPMPADANLIAAAPDGYSIAARLVAHLRDDFRIPVNADEGWIVDTLGHALGGIYMDALVYLAKVAGQ